MILVQSLEASHYLILVLIEKGKLTHGLAFLSQLKLKLNNGMLPNFELISLLEPQKRRQNSCTILRKIGGLSNRIYSERP